MTNQYYKVIYEPLLEINGIIYQVQSYNISLDEFLKQNIGKEMYIYAPSMTTDTIRAIVK
jgi:hypothetical protein